MSDTQILDFLLKRRSSPAKLLQAPVPSHAQLAELLTAAVRVPDHGKLEPWRFVVLERAALARLAAAARDFANQTGIEATQADKGVAQFADSPLCVVVIASPKPSDKIPQIEQTLSTGAVCLSLVNAALGSGWGASWLTGWIAHDQAFARTAYGLKGGEWVAGMIHLGTSPSAAPERPRPDVPSLITWQSE